MTPLAPLIQSFFTDHLLTQRRVAPNTISAYRDTFRLLFEFSSKRLKKRPTDFNLDEIDATLICAFLINLESLRKNSIRTRNARLAAIHSFFQFLALREPDHLALIKRVLAIPQKKFERNLIEFLDEKEIESILASPDQTTWLGQRDHALLLLTLQTGLRVSEVIELKCESLQLDLTPHVRCFGKGRKERCTPLTQQTVKVLRAWLRRRGGTPSESLFPSIHNKFLSRDAVEWLLKKYVIIASQSTPSLKTKSISPHILRHTAAVRLLQSGIDRTVIALWLGHEQIETTQIYLHADLSIKEKALARAAPINAQSPKRFRPDDRLLAFLQSL